MKKALLIIGMAALMIGAQSFKNPTNPLTEICIDAEGTEVTFKIKNDSGDGIRLQFKGSGGDSGTSSQNNNITTEYKKDAGCKVYNYDSGKFLFEVSTDMEGKTIKISDYQ